MVTDKLYNGSGVQHDINEWSLLTGQLLRPGLSKYLLKRADPGSLERKAQSSLFQKASCSAGLQKVYLQKSAALFKQASLNRQVCWCYVATLSGCVICCVPFVGFEAPGTQALCRAWAGSDEHRYVGAEALQLLTRRHHQGVE